MYKISFFVPLTHSEVVKTAMFEAGGGQIGNYDCCCFETLGTGQFRPLSGSNPHLGQKNIIEKVQELKIEMVVKNELITAVVRAMKKAHPYEEVAYDVFRMEEI
ncbi:MAG: YqfO family protein [Bacteriovoracaceae bacterium]